MKGDEFLGKKCSGEGRGKTLGFPTLNVLISSLSEAEHGVYAVRVSLEGYLSEYFGVAHFGARPTFGDMRFSAEVHLFSFSEEIIDGTNVSISRFLPRIRGIKKFSSPEQLKEQIQIDISSAKRILEKYKNKA